MDLGLGKVGAARRGFERAVRSGTKDGMEYQVALIHRLAERAWKDDEGERGRHRRARQALVDGFRRRALSAEWAEAVEGL